MSARLCLPDAGDKDPVAMSLIKNYCFVCMAGAHPLAAGSVGAGSAGCALSVTAINKARERGRHLWEQIGKRGEEN